MVYFADFTPGDDSQPDDVRCELQEKKKITQKDKKLVLFLFC